MSQVTLTVSQLPADFCPTNFSQGFTDAMAFVTANLTGTFNGINFGSTTPTPENRDKPWLRTESTGAPDRWYSYYNGYWVSKHPVVPGVVCMWTGAESSIATLDSGEVATITDISGPFWEKVTALNARFPLGPGTLPSGKVVLVGDTGGEENHTLTDLEMPRHRHQFEVRNESTSNPNQSTSFPIQSNDWDGASILLNTRVAGGDEDFTTDDKNAPANNMPPYSGIFFIKRTARLFYRQ